MKGIIPVVAACFVKRNPTRVLLHRKDEPRNPELLGKWEFVGGMMEYGETPEQALMREIYEELRAKIKVGRLLHAQTNIYADGKHYLVLFYICTFIYDNYLVVAPSGCEWYDPADIGKLDCLPGTYEVAKMLSCMETSR